MSFQGNPTVAQVVLAQAEVLLNPVFLSWEIFGFLQESVFI
jgi:hypothetical protein